MDHSVSLITTMVASLGLALILGFLAVRLRLPALLGYLLAGVLLGPATPGLVVNVQLSTQLAEIGVMLLMFGVGLHFSFASLLAVRRIAVPGAIAQIAVATALGTILASAWGWSLAAGLIFGLSLSVASTVVLIRALEQQQLLSSVNGQIAVGWLVVEDLVMVLVLVLLPAMASFSGQQPDGTGWPLVKALLQTVANVMIFVALILLIGRKLFPWLLWQVAGTGSRELFTLSVIAVAVGIAFVAAQAFGVSFALGAFFAGMVMRESPLSHRAAEESLPLRDAFSVLFFVSVGMLLEPKVLLQQPWQLLAVVLVILMGKSLAAFAIVVAFRYPLHTALIVSASLAQIGEFSFILAGFGVASGLLPPEGQSLILAGALISIALNPLIFRLQAPLQDWLLKHSALARQFQRPHDPLAELPATVSSRELTGHVVVAGCGRVGLAVCEELQARGVTVVAIEQNRKQVENLRTRQIHAVVGDAAEPAVLIQAHIARASRLVIALEDVTRARKMIEIAGMLQPRINVLVRSHDQDEAALFVDEHVDGVFWGERELARSMVAHVLQAPGQKTRE